MNNSTAVDAAGKPVRTFVKTPTEILDAVEAGQISALAGWLYVVLTSYVNNKSGSRKVWPSRGTLARRMGFGKPATVDRYLRELIDADLVVKTSKTIGGFRARNDYEVRLPDAASSPHSGTTLSAPGDSDVRTHEQRCPRPGLPDVRAHGQELEEVEPDQGEPDEDELDVAPPPASSSFAASAGTMTTRKIPKPKRVPKTQRIAAERRRATDLIIASTDGNEAEASVLIATFEATGVEHVGAYVHRIVEYDGEDKLQGLLEDALADAQAA